MKITLPEKEELDKWINFALKLGVSNQELATIAIRKYIADYEKDHPAQIEDFVKDI